MKSPTPSGRTPLRIGGIVLAAGAGSRMGYRPKCLMQRDGESLLAGQLQALSQVGVTELLLVLGHHAERIQQEACLRQFPVRTVRNPQPDAGHVGSLRAGLQALSSELDAVMVVLADQALINAQDMADLLGAFVSRPKGTDMLQPFVQGLPGNPVLFSMSVARQILASDAQVGARQWQQAYPEGLYRWETPNPHYRMDVDNEEDRQTLQALTGHRLCWPDDLSQALGGWTEPVKPKA
jgi:molybdenum cofactor cytidylyltransferase